MILRKWYFEPGGGPPRAASYPFIFTEAVIVKFDNIHIALAFLPAVEIWMSNVNGKQVRSFSPSSKSLAMAVWPGTM
jgi:hypothetical protein